MSRLPAVRPAVVSMAAVLLTWLAAWGIAAAAGLHMDVIVLAVVLSISLGRVMAREGVGTLHHHARRTVLRLVLLPVVAVGASAVGHLLVAHPWWGGAVFCVVLSAAVWVRRFGAAWSTMGLIVSLPFITLLVVPVPLSAASAHSLWPALFAVVAFAVVTVVGLVATALGARPEPSPPAAPVARPVRRPGRLAASTRMAIQLLVGLGVSYALGRWLFPDHWPWVVLSCYVVCSGNRGRGDVVHKGILRLGGALVGTASATLLAGAFPAGDRVAIVLIFVVLALAIWLRQASYAWWAMGVTAMLALLHGYVGVGGVGQLADRLIGVLLGSVIAIVVSWWLLPVRSTDVLRRRLGEALRAYRDDDLPRFGAAVEQVEQLAPAHRFHRRVLRPHPTAYDGHPATLIERLTAVRDQWARSGRRDREMSEEVRAMAAVLKEMGRK